MSYQESTLKYYLTLGTLVRIQDYFPHQKSAETQTDLSALAVDTSEQISCQRLMYCYQYYALLRLKIIGGIVQWDFLS